MAMRPIPVEPPPFFHRGPSPLARLTFFGLLSIALLFADTRYRYLEGLRRAVANVVYPLQRAVQMPGEALGYAASYFALQRAVLDENAELKRQMLLQGAALQGLAAVRQENERLMHLLGLEARYARVVTAAGVLHTGRDPFSQKLFIDK